MDPVDLDEGTDGDLWVIQRMNRKPEFTDAEECTNRGLSTPSSDDDDCFGLQGSTAAIADPGAAGMATIDNGRRELRRRPERVALHAPAFGHRLWNGRGYPRADQPGQLG